MGVKVRTRKLTNGMLSLYLDFYPPLKGKNGKPTRREFLERYLYDNPKNKEEKSINKVNLLFADSCRIIREREKLNDQDGLFNMGNMKRDFIEYFKSLAEDRMESKGNYDNWSCAAHYLVAYSNGDCKMEDLTPQFCEGFKKYLLSADRLNTVKGLKLAQNSAVSYFNKFRAAINAAFESSLININPLKNVKGIKQAESKREFLTQEELEKLAKTDCDLPRLKDAALFSALSGFRWGDIEKLTWGDIQETDGGYFIHNRQQKTKEIMMHPISAQSITFLGVKGEYNEKIFEGLKYSDSNNDKIKRWVLKAGIHKKITLHNFRHTYATLLLNKGVDIFTVSKMLGHSRIETTMIYTKILSETKVAAANVIELNL